MPFVLAQLSDPHIGADWDGIDPVPRLAAAVDAARRHRPGAVLVSGDLAENAGDAEYEQVRELLAPLDVPVHVLPGNHDARAPLRRQFDLPGDADDPVQYVADAGPLRLVVADSTVPGEPHGSLDGGRLEWIDAALAEAPQAPTILAMHHPPLATGIPAWDDFGLAAGERRALAGVLARHRQVRRIVAGHLHRTMTADLAGRPVAVAPSVYVQSCLRFDLTDIEMAPDEPAGFALHAADGDALVTHVQPVARA